MKQSTLLSLIEEGKTVRQIAKSCGVSYSTIRYWLKVFNLKTKTFVAVKKWTDDELIEAVKNSNTIAKVLIALNLDPRGRNYPIIKGHFQRLNLDTSHLIGNQHNLGKASGLGKPLDSYLKNDIIIGSNHLKKRLLKEGYLINECSICHCKPFWNGKNLVLRLDHINGKSKDNRLENLRIVCPNCDSQLPTFCGRNRVVSDESL